MPGDPGATVVTNSCVLFFTREAAGAAGARHSPRPDFGARRIHEATRVHFAPRVRRLMFAVIARSEATKQSIFQYDTISGFASLTGLRTSDRRDPVNSNSEDPMLTLHHLNDSRSQRILLLLEELGTPYVIESYQRNAQTRLGPPAVRPGR